MAIGRMPGARQEELFVAASAVRALDNPFYAALDRFLRESGFDEFAEETCREFYAERMGRPGLPPGVYFRMLMVGYLEGIGVGTGHRVAVPGLDLAAGVSGLRSGKDAAGAFHAVEDAQAAEPGGPRRGVRLGAGAAEGVGAAARQDRWGGFDDTGGERGDARDRAA